jgi:hypothetical protein
MRRRVDAVIPSDSPTATCPEGTIGIVGRRMPQNGPPYLTDGQIFIIQRWIDIGAPNN